MSQTTEYKEGVALVKIIYFTSKTLADGSHPFMLRITKNRERKYIATGLSLHPQFWNKQTGSFRKNIPREKRKQLEADFLRWENEYGDSAEALARKGEAHEAKDIAAKVSDERKITRQFKLLAYFDELIGQFEQTGNMGNRKVYRDVQNNLAKFIKADFGSVTDSDGAAKRIWLKDVSFEQITVKFCNEWEQKMRTNGLTDITLSVKFRTLRAVINKAIGNEYTTQEHYPFARNAAEKRKFQIGKFDTSTTKRAISRADIRKIESYQPPQDYGKYSTLRNKQDRLQLAKDLFLFSYYCGGINFVDIAQLKWSNIGNDLDDKLRLSYTRQKTGGKFSIRLLPPTLLILYRYREASNLSLTNLAASYVFPILNTALHKTPTQRHNRCAKIMSQVNADLKVIGADVGIETTLTTYVARHSFATALKRSGVATAIISEAMGHSDERTTQIYLSDFDTEIVDTAYENL